MNSRLRMLRFSAFLICCFLPAVSSASTVYTADVDPAQSFVFIDGAGPSQISGSLRVIVDVGSIRFENIDLLITPEDYLSNNLLIAAAGSYDGTNFNYMSGPPTLSVIPDYYLGTFDGSLLQLSGYTDFGTMLEYTINSSSVSAVPLPSGLLLFFSGILGLFVPFGKRIFNRM